MRWRMSAAHSSNTAGSSFPFIASRIARWCGSSTIPGGARDSPAGRARARDGIQPLDSTCRNGEFAPFPTSQRVRHNTDRVSQFRLRQSETYAQRLQFSTGHKAPYMSYT